MKDYSIVNPAALKGFARKRALIIPFDLPSFPIKKALEQLAIKHQSYPGHCYYLLDKTVVLYGSTGASNTILSMEQLLKTGSLEFIIFGICGSLRSSFSIGLPIIVEKAFSEEGVSPHYYSTKKAFLPSKQLSDSIAEKLVFNKVNLQKASIVSTDAPYRELHSWFIKKREMGISVVDMETSAVFAVANFHRVKAASIQIVSDELSPAQWKKGFSSSYLKSVAMKIFSVLIDPTLHLNSPSDIPEDQK